MQTSCKGLIGSIWKRIMLLPPGNDGWTPASPQRRAQADSDLKPIDKAVLERYSVLLPRRERKHQAKSVVPFRSFLPLLLFFVSSAFAYIVLTGSSTGDEVEINIQHSRDRFAQFDERVELDAVESVATHGIVTGATNQTSATGTVAGKVVEATQDGENMPPEFLETDKLVLKVRKDTTGTIGSPVTATDPDGDVVTYSLAGVDAALFAINPTSGQLSVVEFKTLDFAAQTEYIFEVVAADLDGLEARRTVVVTRWTSESSLVIGAIAGAIGGLAFATNQGVTTKFSAAGGGVPKIDRLSSHRGT